MLLYAAGSVSIVFFNLILWTLILSKKKRNQIINAYLWWSFCVAAWSVGYAVTLSGFFSYDTKDVKTGDLLDLDFDIEDHEGKLDVAAVRIHKDNGKPRYTYDDKDNRIPVTA